MKLSKSALKRLFSDLLRKRLTDSMFATLIDSLWRDQGSGVGGTPITFADSDDVDFTVDGSEVSAVTKGYTGEFHDSLGVIVPFFDADGNALTVRNGLIKVVTYILTVNSGIETESGLLAGAIRTITADPAPEGYEFDVWTGDVAALADASVNPATVTMPDANVEVTATYREIAEPVAFTMSTISESAAWTPYSMTNSGATLHWEVTGAVATSVDADIPTFDFSTPGTKNIVITNADGFTGLSNVSIAELGLIALNVTALTNLIYLDCSYNNLGSLNVIPLVSLTSLDCVSCNLTTLDITPLINLETLNCFDNELTALDLSPLVNLTLVWCHNNHIPSLDVSNASNLYMLYCYSNQMTSLSVTNCVSLTDLQCWDNDLISLDIENCIIMNALDFNSNHLTKSVVDKILDDLIAQGNDGDGLSAESQTPAITPDAGKVSDLEALGWVVYV